MRAEGGEFVVDVEGDLVEAVFGLGGVLGAFQNEDAVAEGGVGGDVWVVAEAVFDGGGGGVEVVFADVEAEGGADFGVGEASALHDGAGEGDLEAGVDLCDVDGAAGFSAAADFFDLGGFAKTVDEEKLFRDEAHACYLAGGGDGEGGEGGEGHGEIFRRLLGGGEL